MLAISHILRSPTERYREPGIFHMSTTYLANACSSKHLIFGVYDSCPLLMCGLLAGVFILLGVWSPEYTTHIYVLFYHFLPLRDPDKK